jgi:hypothetical protein
MTEKKKIQYDSPLPEGMTCGDCLNYKTCTTSLYRDPKATVCDWVPTKFKSSKRYDPIDNFIDSGCGGNKSNQHVDDVDYPFGSGGKIGGNSCGSGGCGNCGGC